MASVRISETIELPTAESLTRTTGDRWWKPLFRCSICDTPTWRSERFELLGAHICLGCAIGHNMDTEAAGRAYRDAENEKRWERNGWISNMQAHGDVSSPDSFDSPGARWLLRLHNMISEAWENGRFDNESGEDRQDVLTELADGAVEIYTHSRWQIFVDLTMYNEDENDRCENGADLTEVAGEIMFDVAYKAMSGWLDERIEESKCDECGELPGECCCGEEDESDD